MDVPHRQDTPGPHDAPAADAARAFLDAAHAGDLAAVRAALDADPALVRALDDAGDSALVRAAFRGHREVAWLVAERAREAGALDAWEAALVGDVARLRALLDADPSLVRARRHDGWPVLHLAAFYGHPEVAALLVDRGADVDARSANHLANTALHATLAISGDLALAALLLARGADANAVGAGGYRPLHLAASRGSVPAVELLLAHGADPAAPADDGRTAAGIAAERGHEGAAARLAAG